MVEVLLYVHRNRRFIGDGEHRTATSTLTQLLNSKIRLFLLLLKNMPVGVHEERVACSPLSRNMAVLAASEDQITGSAKCNALQ